MSQIYEEKKCEASKQKKTLILPLLSDRLFSEDRIPLTEGFMVM